MAKIKKGNKLNKLEFIGETVVVMILLGSPERGAGEQSETEGSVP